MQKTLTLLGIESSCDDTAAAVVRGTSGAASVLSSVVEGQTSLHADFGGVVPEIAARAHAERLDGCIAQALSHAGLTLADIDAIAVTAGPGLIGGVMSGVALAKGLSAGSGKPLIGVNHLAGHALTPRLTESCAAPKISPVSAAQLMTPQAKHLTKPRVSLACPSPADPLSKPKR
jgi:N6-L-threonylcarbamoyladenine synthase